MDFQSRCCGKLWIFFLILFLILAFLLNMSSSITFFLMLGGMGNAFQYFSDRVNLPFPILFKEFDLSNKDAILSGIHRQRGVEETCYRRILSEYETYRLGKDRILHHISSDSFKVSKDAPSGWLSYTPIKKACMVIFDAMRLDYAVHDPMLDKKDLRSIFTNKFPLIHELLVDEATRDNSRIFRLICPSPTITSVAFKLLITGDGRVSGINSETINPKKLVEDNIGYEAHVNDRTIAVLGCNVMADMIGKDIVDIDYTTDDKNFYRKGHKDSIVRENYREAISYADLVVFHLLGIDDLGHSGRRLSEDMSSIMADYNRFLGDVIREFSKHPSRMLFVGGDHGQKYNGSHGQDSPEETDTFLFVHSDLELNKAKSEVCKLTEAPQGYAKSHCALSGKCSLGYEIGEEIHMNIPTTISLLTNVPVPFRSEGILIEDSVPFIKGPDGKIDRKLSLRYLVQLKHVNVHSILRIIDTSLDTFEKIRDTELLSNFKVERIVLANMHNFVRSLPDVANDAISDEDLEKIYEEYGRQCKKLSHITRNIIKANNVAFVPDHIFAFVLVSIVSIIMLFYLITCKIMIYRDNKFEHRMSVADSYVLKGGDDADVSKVFFRLVKRILTALFISFILNANIDSYIDLEKVGKIFWWHPGITEPFSVHSIISGVFFETCEDKWFALLLVFSVVLFVLFLFDIPYLIRSYNKPRLREDAIHIPGENYAERDSVSYGDAEKSCVRDYLNEIGKLDFRYAQFFYFTIMMITVLTSDSAVRTQDSISRHIFILTIFTTILPYFLANYGIKPLKRETKSLIRILLVFKISSFFHSYVDISVSRNTDTKQWEAIEGFMKLFEPNALSLFLFYLSLLWILRDFAIAGRGKNYKPDIYDFAEYNRVTYMKRHLLLGYRSLLLMKIIWFMQFLSVFFHFAAKAEDSIFPMHWTFYVFSLIFHKSRITSIKKMTEVFSVRMLLVLTVLSLLLIIVNTIRIYPHKNENILHKNSGAIFLVIVSLWWMVFPLSRYQRAMHVYFCAIIIYNVVMLMVAADIRSFISVYTIVYTTCDVLYFTSGYSDSIFELPFESAFIFDDVYRGRVSDVVVFLSVTSLNIVMSAVAAFIFFFNSECFFSKLCDSRYVEMSTEVLENKLKDVDATTEDGDWQISAPSPNLSSIMDERKRFILRDTLFFISLYIFGTTVKTLVTFVVILLFPDVHSLISFVIPKAMFIIVRSMVVTVSLCIFYGLSISL